MVNWAWILVALLLGNFIGFVVCAIGERRVIEEEKDKHVKIGYANASEAMTGGIIDRLAEIQRTLLRVEGEINDSQLGDVSGDGDIRNGD